MATPVPPYLTKTGSERVEDLYVAHVEDIPLPAKLRSRQLAVPIPQTDVSIGGVEFRDYALGLCPPYATTLVGAYIIPVGALTANNTNFATISISRLTDGAQLYSATTEITGTGDWIAFHAVDLGADVGNPTLPGDPLQIRFARVALGVVIPECVLVIEYLIDN